MIGLWIAAAFLAAGTAALVLTRAARGALALGRPDPAVGVYRRALAEIDDLAERDLIAGEETREARAEAGRRLLSAADRVAARPTRALGRGGSMIIAAVAPLLAMAIYLAIGSPQSPDQPFASRLAAWQAHPEQFQIPELTAALKDFAARHPDNPEPLRRLAALELAQGDASGAVHALRKALTIAPGRADILASLGEIMVLQAGGVVQPDAQAVFRQALTRDPSMASARYYLARAQIAKGDVTGGLAAWQALFDSLPANDPDRAGLGVEIGQVRQTGRLPTTVPAPSAQSNGQISAAIRGMVDGLAARLADHPDDPAGWVRLVRAYGVLGEHDKQAAALAQAQQRFAKQPDVLAALAAASRPSPSR